MPREVRLRAFEPFFSTKPKGEGTGLGLATVYGIVAQAGGEVVIDSAPGHGTTIRVHIPVTVADVTAPAVRTVDVNPSARGETILLVEDEDMVRELARRILARAGYTVLTAADADTAVVAARAHEGRIDLVLTDVIMPGRSGRELVAELSTLFPDVRVLYMSGYSADTFVDRGVLDRGVNLIEKPFDPKALLQRVRTSLDDAGTGGP